MRQHSVDRATRTRRLLVETYPGTSTTSGASYTLLSNASATGSYVEVAGGSYVWSAVGTFSGATLTLQARGPDGSTAIDVTTLMAAGSAAVDIGDGTFMRVAITGGPPSGIYSELRRT